MSNENGLENVLKGTVKNLRNGKEFKFYARETHRDEQGGTLRFHGTMVDPEGNSSVDLSSIAVNLSNKADSGTEIPLTDARVLFVAYSRNGATTRNFYADKEKPGFVTLQHSGDRINGKLQFTTEALGDDSYEVDVIFDQGPSR
ncbi:hypothetical protein GXB78_04795 [Pseudomonas moraviensis subsp. stanleyae]|uniref:hypothetical protein n=1 Tax=Pseudomonas moraviensis TaxID=321662 RepID=UPI002E34CB1E|nr:hypothetical protein [Pseudomonas moraviensis]MED7666531.1 hypothetical protein [Pseudomonas moraviensis subsp. stanleyae]